MLTTSVAFNIYYNDKSNVIENKMQYIMIENIRMAVDLSNKAYENNNLKDSLSACKYDLDMLVNN